MSKQDDKTFIIHTKKPPFIAELVKFKTLEEKAEYLKNESDEFIEPDSFSAILIRKYLGDMEWKRKEYILKRMLYWYRS